MGGSGPGYPLSRSCYVTPQTHHPPARARFTSDNLDRKFNMPQADGATVPPGPLSPVASWLNRSTRTKRRYSYAVSKLPPPGFEAGIIPLDHVGTLHVLQRRLFAISSKTRLVMKFLTFGSFDQNQLVVTLQKSI